MGTAQKTCYRLAIYRRRDGAFHAWVHRSWGQGEWSNQSACTGKRAEAKRYKTPRGAERMAREYERLNDYAEVRIEAEAD